MDRSAQEALRDQVKAAKGDLKAYEPTSIDWFGRASDLVDSVVPALCERFEEIARRWEQVMSAPDELARFAARCAVLDGVDARGSDQVIADASLMASFVPNSVASKMFDTLLTRRFEDLRANSASDYPDLFRTDLDYSGLPIWNKDQYAKGYAGGSVRKSTQRPVRVPDGIELKTIETGKGVDCHYPHMGFHLVLHFERGGKDKPWRSVAIRGAFLKRDDYRVGKRTSEANTVKASFPVDDRFVYFWQRQE